MKFWANTSFSPPEHNVPLARAAEEAGLYGILMSDHIFYPRVLNTPYPYSPYEDGRPIWEPEVAWPDVWVTIGAMQAVTTRLHFGTGVYIAPARDLFTVAKQVGTAAVLSEDGWLRTGDIGAMDEDGYVTLVDRIKDIILCGGFNVYPRHVEDAIYRHPDIVAATEAKADKKIDDLQQQYDQLGCPSAELPPEHSRTPVLPPAPGEVPGASQSSVPQP